MTTDKMREEFEAWVRDEYRCGEYSLSRDHDGRYYNVVGDKYHHATYAEVSMLWATWQAATRRALPEGFVAVPSKATQAMADAACTVDRRLSAFKAADIYAAMLKAAPATNDAEQ